MNLAVWSGPRNISTALMYSFGNRDDFEIIDEPFYSNYLIETGLDHPMREEIILSQPENVDQIILTLSQKRPVGGKSLYQKHMSQHMTNSIPRSWFDQVKHIFLLRHPARVISSFSKKFDNVSENDIGFKKQVELFSEVIKQGLDPIVVNSEDIRKSTEKKAMSVPSRMATGRKMPQSSTFTTSLIARLLRRIVM